MKKITKYFVMFGLISGFFLLGVLSGLNKGFPVNILFKYWDGGVYRLWEGRNFQPAIYEEVDLVVSSKTGVYITYGQSNSNNSGVLETRTFKNTFMSLNQKSYKYKNPSLGGSGYGGSVWGYVGEKLVSKGFHDKVIFSNAGWDGHSIHSLNSGYAFNFFVKAYEDLKNKYGRVDGILFHQGESDNKLDLESKYTHGFEKFLLSLEKNQISSNIYLSRASYCPGQPSSKKIIDQQNNLIKVYDFIYPGPQTDKLGADYRIKNDCHFDIIGLEKFSDMWVNSLIQLKNKEID